MRTGDAARGCGQGMCAAAEGWAGRAQRCRAELPSDGRAADAGPGADGGAAGDGAVPQAAEGGGQGEERGSVAGGVACEQQSGSKGSRGE